MIRPIDIVVYVAGPFTGNREKNIERARKVGLLLKREGFTVIVPHNLGPGLEEQVPGEEEYWYRATEQVLMRCDAIALAPLWQYSKGATAEKKIAERLGLPEIEFFNDQEWPYEPLRPQGEVMMRFTLSCLTRGPRIPHISGGGST